MQQAGLLDHALRTAKQSVNPCNLNRKTNAQQEKRQSDPILLKLEDFSAAFLLFGSGIGLAILALLSEFIFVKFLEKKSL